MQHLEQSNRFGVPAPKTGALPTALHPDTVVLYTIRMENATEIYRFREIRRLPRKCGSLVLQNCDFVQRNEIGDQTLNRKLTMSPSFMIYSFPSLRTLPWALAAAMEPIAFMSSKAMTSARMKPRSKSVWILPAA